MTTIDMSQKPVFPTQKILDIVSQVSLAELLTVTSIAVAPAGYHQFTFNKLHRTAAGANIYFDDVGIALPVHSVVDAYSVTISITGYTPADFLGIPDDAVVEVNRTISKTANAPHILQVETGASTVAAIEGRCHADAPWVELATFAPDTKVLYIPTQRINFMRITRKSGSANVVAYAQG